MAAHRRNSDDPEFDEPGVPPSTVAPMTRTTWLLAGVALMSLAWAASSSHRFLRRERTHLLAALPWNNSEASPHSDVGSTARPSALRPPLAVIPASVRTKGLPSAEVGLAADMIAAEERGGDALWRSHEAMGVHPTDSQRTASDRLKRHVRPGQEIDGWLVQVEWSILRDQGGSSKYNYTGVPPVYELSLRFPEKLAGYEVWLWGHNYDFLSNQFTCPNHTFGAVKDGDWVRVFGVLRPYSQIEWEPGKSDDFLSLGEMTITDIQRVEVDHESTLTPILKPGRLRLQE